MVIDIKVKKFYTLDPVQGFTVVIRYTYRSSRNLFSVLIGRSTEEVGQGEQVNIKNFSGTPVDTNVGTGPG